MVVELDDERSVVTLPELLLPPGAGALRVPEALPLTPGAGAGALVDEELESLDLSAGAEVALEDELDPGWA
jgi:hypothetical protein